MKRVTDETDFTTRVYQYGAVPIDAFPDEGVEEFFRGNRLWNNLFALNYEHREANDQTKCDADSECASFLQSMEKLNEAIDSAYDNKRNAKMKASTKDASHPLIQEANEKIRDLQIKRRALWEPLKSARKRTDKEVEIDFLLSLFPRKISSTFQRFERYKRPQPR